LKQVQDDDGDAQVLEIEERLVRGRSLQPAELVDDRAFSHHTADAVDQERIAQHGGRDARRSRVGGVCQLMGELLCLPLRLALAGPLGHVAMHLVKQLLTRTGVLLARRRGTPFALHALLELFELHRLRGKLERALEPLHFGDLVVERGHMLLPRRLRLGRRERIADVALAREPPRLSAVLPKMTFQLPGPGEPGLDLLVGPHLRRPILPASLASECHVSTSLFELLFRPS
jgi:hypothetical protein